jgi:hypothetical protein
MLRNNFVIFNIKQLILNIKVQTDKNEIKNRIKNTYFNKIITNNCVETHIKK